MLSQLVPVNNKHNKHNNNKINVNTKVTKVELGSQANSVNPIEEEAIASTSPTSDVDPYDMDSDDGGLSDAEVIFSQSVDVSAGMNTNININMNENRKYKTHKWKRRRMIKFRRGLSLYRCLTLTDSLYNQDGLDQQMQSMRLVKGVLLKCSYVFVLFLALVIGHCPNIANKRTNKQKNVNRSPF